MRSPISKDTRLCMSLAARPGNFGTRFHNFLYDELNLDYVYKAFTSTDLEGAVRGIRALDIRGCAVSMPFKEACIPMLDELDASAAVIGSVNTIVNTGGHLKAYNTDYIAVESLLKSHAVPTSARVALRGSGGMAKAVAYALKGAGFANGVIVARSEAAGQALAQGIGYEWQPDVHGLQADLLVNVTPIGMAGGAEAAELAFVPGHIAAAHTVFDVVALPAETPLIVEARRQGRRVITGAEVATLQALEQFVLYTGVRPTPEQVARAEAWARNA
ncbi:shikimate 5-dehydrogenase [Deinococcus ruber]|uniref:Shikimate 5-dehydrogenase n=1 Tax=Deinococcus ruber TaxID=1848197 RepID=A0A918FIC5_9DEIO|nr:shikimate 5-dehydrogenase [Deinococcus ruber]GGR39181.1 shikimate 5-dehydrogenase [Deinococcus ruber]